MANTRVISKFETLLPSEDYKFLRAEGIKYIEKLASKLWTDYNTHDPGITILELLCYAITELGYRSSYLIEDILASDPASGKTEPKQFFTAAEILPCNPVTVNDLRKLVIDVEGIKNAWLKKADSQEQNFYADPQKNVLTYNVGSPENLVELNGLYDVLVDFEKDELEDREREAIKKNIRAKLYNHRNLCEDFLSIDEVQHEEISVCADIELDRDAKVDDVLTQIYYKIFEYFSPSINFYTIDELLQKGKSAGEIFEGPLLEHGFIDSGELDLADLRTELRVSDIINFIMDIKGVIAVRNFSLSSYIDGKVVKSGEKWILQLTSKNHSALLNIDKSKIVFYKEILPYIADNETVKSKIKEMKEFNKKFKLVGHDTDFEIPEGEFMDIEDYYPVQNEFPLCYGIGEEGLREPADFKRKAQAKQLKAYLLFFEQIFANYFSQLANVKYLFSINDCIDKTYFSQVLSMVPDVKDLYLNYNELQNDLQLLSEDSRLFEKRRNKFLDHLMGRFCEEINEYSLLLYSLLESGTNKELIKNKLVFLNNYPWISSDRGKAFNYMENPKYFDPDNISGMQKRIYRLLGFRSPHHLLVEEESGKYFIKLYDPGSDSSVLLTSNPYSQIKAAESDLKYMTCQGSNYENYITIQNESGKFYFEFIKNSTDIIAASGLFENELELEKAKTKVVEFFQDHLQIENLPVVEFSNNLINIEEIDEEENGDTVKKYYIVVYNPNNISEVLLTGIKYTDKECTESILHYILSHGDNIDSYKRLNGESGFSFGLLNECGDTIASSKKFENVNERDKKLNETILFFRNQCDLEGFHIVEHILLRPKSGKEELLPVCLPQYTPPKKKDKTWYEFEIYLDKPKVKGRKSQWRFRLKDNKSKVIIRSEDYKHLNDCKYAITLIKKTLSESGDIRVLNSGHNKFYFNMVAENNEIFCTSNFWKTKLEVLKVLKGLKEFFAQEKTSEIMELKSFDKDPYSFRISVILPSWPEKFRNINFRRFVEKTIRMETPAHIYPRICWIDLLQMRKFETAYKNWLKELQTSKPDVDTVNTMIEILFNLKNVYPVVKLHDCQAAKEDEPQVVLDYSALGII